MYYKIIEIFDGFYEFGWVTYQSFTNFAVVRPAVAFILLAINVIWQRLNLWLPFFNKFFNKFRRLLEKRVRSLVFHALNYRLGKMGLQFIERVLWKIQNFIDPRQINGNLEKKDSTTTPLPQLLHYKRLSTQFSLKNTPRTEAAFEELVSSMVSSSPLNDSVFNETFDVGDASSQENAQGTEKEDYIHVQRKIWTSKIRKWRIILETLLHLEDPEEIPDLEPSPVPNGNAKSPKDSNVKDLENSTLSEDSYSEKRKRKRSNSEGDTDQETHDSDSSESSFEDWPSYGTSTNDDSRLSCTIPAEADENRAAEPLPDGITNYQSTSPIIQQSEETIVFTTPSTLQV